MSKNRYANPTEGVYYNPKTDSVFVLRDQDGPYPLKDALRQRASLYTLVNQDGTHKRVIIGAPFKSVRLGDFE